MPGVEQEPLSILVVSQHYWPETFRINEVVRDLRNSGTRVDVLTGQPNYPRGTTFEGYRAAGFGHEYHPEGYLIHRVPVVPRGSSGDLRRIANYLSFVFSGLALAPWLTRGRRYDVIFVYGVSPILQGLPAILLKRIKRAALVIWVQDLWPDSLLSTGYVRNRQILAAVAALTRFIYRRADLLLAQSRSFVPKIAEMAGRGAHIAYHPNPGDACVAAKRGQAPPANPTAEDEFRIVFAGNLGVAQALETVVEAAARIGDPSIRILLVGAGSRESWLRQEIARRNLRNIELAGAYPPDRMPEIFANASALLVTLRRDYSLGLTIPSKVATYMAAERPIIASLDGEAAAIIREAGAGLVTAAEDAQALASAIIAMKAMPGAQRRSLGHAGRAYFERNFAPELLTRSLLQHFRQLQRNTHPDGTK